MYYTIYKVTNQINGKYYIGKHVTFDLEDGYMGSGNLIKRAIQKYGIDNFSKEYLEILDSEAKMNLAEKIYVINDLEVSYNLCPGGHGGFGYINNNCLNNKDHDKEKISKVASLYMKEKWQDRKYISFFKKMMSNSHKIHNRSHTYFGNRGDLDNSIIQKAHSNEANKKRKETMKKNNHSKGIKNSQYNTCWITNGQENKKIKKEDLDLWLELGYYKGRVNRLLMQLEGAGEPA